MSWLKIDDRMPAHFKLNTMDSRVDNERLLAKFVVLLAYCAANGTDGYLAGAIVRDTASPKFLAVLRRSVFGRPPLLHAKGEDCYCLQDRAWPAGSEYAIHDYLDHNPRYEEENIHRRQKKERDDRELRLRVRRRDRDCCRYCAVTVNFSAKRGKTKGHLDHVDPMQTGEANLVVACADCNQRKGRRTPEAAGMTLLDIPDEAEVTGESKSGFTGDSRGTRCTSRGRDGSGRGTEDKNDTHRPRDALEGNPYLRSALTGPQPERHAGVPPELHRQAEGESLP